MARWRYGRRELCGTMMLCKATHMLDVMSAIAGARPARISSFGGQNYFVHSVEITGALMRPRAASCPVVPRPMRFVHLPSAPTGRTMRSR